MTTKTAVLHQRASERAGLRLKVAESAELIRDFLDIVLVDAEVGPGNIDRFYRSRNRGVNMKNHVVHRNYCLIEEENRCTCGAAALATRAVKFLRCHWKKAARNGDKSHE